MNVVCRCDRLDCRRYGCVRTHGPVVVAAPPRPEEGCVSAQTARDQSAKVIVANWAVQKPRPEQVLHALTEFAQDPSHLHLTPHLVTQARLQGLHPDI